MIFDHFVQFVFFVVAVVGFYFNINNNKVQAEKRAVEAENRLTILEKEVENQREFKRETKLRLANHDEQNKAILVLAEQVKNLGMDLKELKSYFYSKGE